MSSNSSYPREDWITSRLKWLYNFAQDTELNYEGITHVYNETFGEHRSVLAVSKKLSAIKRNYRYSKEEEQWLSERLDKDPNKVTFHFNKKFGTYRPVHLIRMKMYYMKKALEENKRIYNKTK